MSDAALLPASVVIAGGEFVMGNDGGRKDEQPAHSVRVRAFRAGVAPVTNEEYARFLEATGHEPPPFLADERFNDPACPVVGVSWYDAVAYCGWLAATTGVGWRLPTEAEREFAARGGLSGADWPWGPERDGHPAYAAITAMDRPHAPGAECANAFGLRCTAENVHEWCSDWYDPAYYHQGVAEDPTGPAEGQRKVSRGGSWRHAEKFTRASARASLVPGFRYNDFGLRVYA